MRRLESRRGRMQSRQFVIVVPQRRRGVETGECRGKEAAVKLPAPRLEEEKVFPDGLALCALPTGGGRMVAIPSLPQCRRAVGPPVDRSKVRLFAWRHSSRRGELFAMQRIEIMRCTRHNRLLTAAIFPERSAQGALGYFGEGGD